MSRLLLTLVLLLPVSAACSRYLVAKPTPSVPTVSYKEPEEVRISREFHREAKKKLKFVRNLEVERYVDRIGRRILGSMGPQPFDYRFFVIENSELNAFAIPGGTVYVHTGLIERAKNTDELAAVLGHEIVHIKARHMARMSGPDILSLVGLLGIFLGGGGAGAQAAGALGQALSLTRQLSYLRQLEQEADTLGIKYMAEAGYDPAGALRFLKMLEQENSLNPVDVPRYLLTHPLTPDRIANAETAIRSLRPQSKPSVSDPTDPIRKIQVLLRLERRETDSVVSHYEDLRKRLTEVAEPGHFLALAYQESGAWEKAKENFEKARTLNPGSPGIDRDLGRLYLQLGEFGLAYESFQRSLKIQPEEALTYVYLGELFERQRKFPEAIDAHLKAHQMAPLWPEPPHHLGVSYGKINRLGEAHYYLGRSQMLQDEDEKAIVNLERALKIFGSASSRGQTIKEELEIIKARK